ncbi:MFS general substrate transporter [Polychaeton citri CBS 116435]|uniref:Cercosporin MFS transporter CTB4 n=1 Tax=Polychaeton citri CBS 116435 TaxID=1314669 RepID=A0A9P4PZD8_9PEZI|nr:MFS general substrate transporter [Polychaeton citri CBS 116435]
MSLALLNMMTTFSSSVFGSTTRVTAREFGVSNEVMILATSLFLVGFIFGPFIFAPLSELYGRQTPMLCGFFVLALFQIPVAVAQNLGTILVCRFLQGVFSSSAQAIAGGALADIWNAQERGLAVPVFAASLFVGPILGPIVRAFVTESSLGWRWIQWITMIVAAFFGTGAFFIVPETYGPVLLARRAKRLRFNTGNWALHSRHEAQEVWLQGIITRYIARPMKMLVLEPMLTSLTVYMAFVFGLTYLCFQASPISFGQDRGFPTGTVALPLISILVGAFGGCLVIATTTKTMLAPNPEQGRVQEARLGLTIGLFWFAWTSFPSTSPWPQIIAVVPIGFGLILITLQGMNYIIDCYLRYANSALAANTSVRYCFAAGFPLFATSMWDTLGVQWATSLLGFVGLALLPLPVLFYISGPKIRSSSRYVPE